MIKNIYWKIHNRIIDYRYKVPGNAGVCFAYYMIIGIIPICTLCAFIARIFNLDLDFLKVSLEHFLNPAFSEVVMNALDVKRMTFTSTMVLIVSTFISSRGINQLYSISKELFPPDHKYNFIIEQAITILKTIGVFLLILIIMSIFTFFPVIKSLFRVKWIFLADSLMLYVILFIVMYLLYTIIPDSKVHPLDVGVGALVAAGLTVILINILGLYFGIVDYSNVYGPLATIVIFLLSFTFIAEVIYIGMYVMFEQHMKRLITEMRKQLEDTIEEATTNKRPWLKRIRRK